MDRSNYDLVTGKGLPPPDDAGSRRPSVYALIWWGLVLFVILQSC